MNKQELANWLYANRDRQDTPEFNEKKSQFFALDSAPQTTKVPPRGEDSVKILQDEFIKEYERKAATSEEQSRKEANLAALTRELATLKAQPPAVEKQVPPVEEESEALSSLRQDMGQIEAKRQEQQPSDMRLNAQIAGAAIGAVPGAVQQAAVMKEAGGRGLGAAMNAIAERVRGPSAVSDLTEDVIRGEIPQGTTAASLNQNATRFYRQFPNELANGDMAAGGRGTYAYARSFQLPIELSMQAVDLKDAQRLVQERRAGTLAAQAAFPSETLVERPTSGVLTLGERREPRARLIIGGDQSTAPTPPPSPPQQPRSALPPGQPLTGAPPPRMTAGTNPFQPGTAALLQSRPQETPMPSIEPGAPPPGVQGGRREPTLGMLSSPAVQGPAALGEARPTSAARPPVQSALDAITNLFKSKDNTLSANPIRSFLDAVPIVPKTLGGMQIGGGGTEMATGMKQGDTGKVGTGAAETLGGGLSMFRKTAPSGMAISVLTELYRNARTPEDRQKIMDTLNQMMFGQQQTM
jgi:hypothetical protein